MDSEGWDWLPTGRNEPDPIHDTVLADDADDAGLGPARRAAEEAAEHQVSAALHAVPDRVPALALGARDFTPMARAGAVYAARAAALELVAGQPGFWCRVVRLYAAGYWPCGLTAGGQLVVL